jgi:hypothetical protein
LHEQDPSVLNISRHIIPCICTHKICGMSGNTSIAYGSS